MSVIIIEVPYAIKKLVFIKSEGLPNGVYLRAGSNTRKATQEYIEELMLENKRVSYDEEPVKADIGILSSNLLKSILGDYTQTRLLADKVLTHTETNPKKYYPTVAGVLAYCETPHLYIPEAVVHCKRFRGREGREIIQSEEI